MPRPAAKSERNRWENLKHLKATDEIKFVIGTVEDYEWAKQKIAEHKLERLSPALFVGASARAGAAGQIAEKGSAGQTPISRRELAEKIIADALPVRFQVQLHKIIWPPEQRGVIDDLRITSLTDLRIRIRMRGTTPHNRKSFKS